MPFLTVTSNSMSPLLRKGDLVGLTAPAVEQLAAGDIIVLTGSGHFTTHRYWNSQFAGGRNWLVTRGDRPLKFDPPWSQEQYVGRVVVRRRGRRALWLDRGPGRWLNARLSDLARLEGKLFARRAGDTVTQPLTSPARRVLLGYAVLLTTACAALGSRVYSEGTAVALTQNSHR